MKSFLVYNFSGELDDVAHLFPNERLARIAAILDRVGHDVVILDRANFTDLKRFGSAFFRNLGSLAYDESNGLYEDGVRSEAAEIVAGGFDCVFMNLWHGTGFKFSVDLAAELKRLQPGIVIFGVGQKVDWFAGHILELAGDRLDGLVTGLGYNAVELLAQGRRPAEIPNMLLRGRDGVVAATGRQVLQVDDYPPPLYDETTYRSLDAKVPVYSLTLSNQACPNQCAFCVRPENYGRSTRRRDVQTVLNEISSLHARRGATHFRLEDSTPPRTALTELAAAITESDLRGKLTLSAFARVDSNGAEDFALMKRAGFLSLFFGLESLDDGNLVRLKKGITYPAIRATLEKAHGAGILTVGCFIFPTPGETAQSRDTTLERIRELKPVLDSALVVPAGVYPPTDWGRNPGEYGVRLAENYIREAIVYPIRFEVPMEHWRPFPFTYRLFGKEAELVTFDEIVAAHKQFVLKVGKEFGIPRIPDYYALLAHWKQRGPPELAREIVGCVVQRDYAGLERMLLGRGEGSA